MTDQITTPAQMREAAALAVANIEIGYHDGIGGDWHPYNGLHIISAACAAIHALPVAERQAIRDRALEDAAQGVSNRAAYWWDEAMAASDARRWKLSIVYEAKALACTETAAAIRAMKGRPE